MQIHRRLMVAWLAALTLSLTLTRHAAGDPPELVGILPFDAVTNEGYSATASRGLARMLRAEMIRDRRLTPSLLELPGGTRPPLPPSEAASLGREASVDLILAGTVIGAEVDRKGLGGSSGGRLGAFGLGGRLGRTKATVTLQIQLIDPADGRVIDTFDVEAESASFSGGTNAWTEIGRLDFDDADWARTPVAKALRQAALDIIDRVADRTRAEVER